MADFQFTKATKAAAKLRMAISGPSGSGKSWTALTLASAMCKKIAAIDTEHGSLSKYADQFHFDTLELNDFHPENYIGAIKSAQMAGYDGLIIDSASHEWSGHNGCLELLDVFAKKNKAGNNWAAWSDVTPLHNAFIEAIHQADMHIFVTYRSKMDYIQTIDKNGYTVIKKVGMNPITREGGEYEHDVVGEMDLDHNMVISKTRCPALADKVIPKPGKDLAQILLGWLSAAPAATNNPLISPERQKLLDRIAQNQKQWGVSDKWMSDATAYLLGVPTDLNEMSDAELVRFDDYLKGKVDDKKSENIMGNAKRKYYLDLIAGYQKRLGVSDDWIQRALAAKFSYSAPLGNAPRETLEKFSDYLKGKIDDKEKAADGKVA